MPSTHSMLLNGATAHRIDIAFDDDTSSLDHAGAASSPPRSLGRLKPPCTGGRPPRPRHDAPGLRSNARRQAADLLVASALAGGDSHRRRRCPRAPWRDGERAGLHRQGCRPQLGTFLQQLPPTATSASYDRVSRAFASPAPGRPRSGTPARRRSRSTSTRRSARPTDLSEGGRGRHHG